MALVMTKTEHLPERTRDMIRGAVDEYESRQSLEARGPHD
jgi:hypothetical protein